MDVVFFKKNPISRTDEVEVTTFNVKEVSELQNRTAEETKTSNENVIVDVISVSIELHPKVKDKKTNLGRNERRAFMKSIFRPE